MIKKIKKNKRGFVILFAVTLSAILLSIALGVAYVAQKEIHFGTSGRDTNDAFFAADTGIECALFYDKPTSAFPVAGPAIPLTCAASTFTPVFSGTSTTGLYSFTMTGLGTAVTSCAKVTVFKDNTTPPLKTSIVAKGYNVGDGTCSSTSITRVEREIDVTY